MKLRDAIRMHGEEQYLRLGMSDDGGPKPQIVRTAQGGYPEGCNPAIGSASLKLRYILIGILAAFVGLSCAREPKWDFRRVILDEGGAALPGVGVQVRIDHDLHSARAQVGADNSSSYRMSTDGEGSFKLRSSCTILSLVIDKAGYLPKTFVFNSHYLSPREIPETGSITLQKARVSPEADELDRRGSAKLDLLFSPQEAAVGVDLIAGQVVPPTSAAATFVVRLYPRQLEVSGLQSTEICAVEWETGLTVESWKENHRSVPTVGFQRGITLKCPARASRVAVSGAFFTRSRGVDQQPFFARVYISTVTLAQYEISYDLSRDAAFYLTPP